MISLFLKEQKRYSQEKLANLFKCDSEQIVRYIKKLKEYGVLKAVKATKEQRDLTDLAEQDVEIENTNAKQQDYYYVFSFVGVITVFGRVLKCYPKYISSKKNPTADLKVILKVLDKYNAKEQIIHMFNDSDRTKSFNLLAVMLYLLKDYYEYGSYTTTMDVTEINGTGEIQWDKTINDSFVYLQNNRPYYTELYTHKRLNNNLDYFKKLHEIILSKCSKELQAAGLTELFDLMEVNLSDEKLENFGEIPEILYNIQKEINVQFNTRKNLLLRTLYAYVAQSNHSLESDAFSTYGTNSFNLVWEKVCSETMDNQLRDRVRNLPISIPNVNQSLRLIDLIEKPKWWLSQNFTREESFVEAKETLIPDIVTITKDVNSYNFIILDAKYYNLVLTNDKVSGQPGIESITKQYLYQLAFKSTILSVKIDHVSNCFLLPTEGDVIIDKGYVSLNMLDKIGLKRIQVRQIPAKEIYLDYIYDKKFPVKKLELL